MSMDASLIAVSGIYSAENGLSTISNNIANAQTTGFKSGRSEFYDMFYGSQNSSGFGSRVQTVYQNFSQGAVNQTGNELDLALIGDGMFVLEDQTKRNEALYSRNGSFKLDKEGYITDQAGNRLLGHDVTAITPATSVSGLTTIKIGDLIDEAKGTSSVNIDLNLNAGAVPTYETVEDPTTKQLVRQSVSGVAFTPVNLANQTYDAKPNFTANKTLYDADGIEQRLTVNYYKVGTNPQNTKTSTGVEYGHETTDWYAQYVLDGYTGASGSTAIVHAYRFDNTGKMLDSSMQGDLSQLVGNTTVPESITTDIAWTNISGSAKDISFTLSVDKMSQITANYNIRGIAQDGYAKGAFDGFTINPDGVIDASYTNGSHREVGQVALAKFINVQDLEQMGNQQWTRTRLSGLPTIGTAQGAGFGSIQSGALETSNVDVANELVNMIFMQKMYQSSSQVISTDKELKKTIIQL